MFGCLESLLGPLGLLLRPPGEAFIYPTYLYPSCGSLASRDPTVHSCARPTPFSLPIFVQIPPFPWLPFLPLPWAVLGSSWAPKSSQVGPKLPPEAPLLRKLRFPKKRAPPCMGTRFWGPGPLRTSSRRPRELFKTILTGVLFQPHF